MTESTKGSPGEPTTTEDDPDPTDAPDLTGSALSKMSRFGLVGSLAQILGALLVLTLSIVSPDRISSPVARAVGVVLALVSLSALIAGVRSSPPRRTTAVLGLAGSVAGIMLMTDPGRWLTPIGWVTGGLTMLLGAWIVWRQRVGAADHEASTSTGVFLMSVGVIVFLFTEPLFEVAAVTSALLLVASGAIGLGVRSGLVTIAPPTAGARWVLVRWIEGKVASTEHREEIYESVFFEGRSAPARIGRFLLMMLFASVISAAGVVSDSTAVVIGAMLVAPLINPMMGMGLSLVTGWPNRLGRSTLIVLAGGAVAVAVGWMIPIATDIAVDVEANAQIVGRSSPTLVDLLIAVAAGAAGAYGLSRKDASSSLPGVAVAIALVPPLSVIGVTAEAGDWRQTAGTLLLFLTNLVAIIVAGGAVFVLTGVVPMRRFAEHQHRVRTAVGAVAVLAMIVVGGLVINGRQIAQDALDQDDARAVTADWLGDGSTFDVVSVTVDDGDVAVVLAGPGEPPSPERLARALETALGAGLQLDLQWIPRERIVIASD